MFFCDSSGLFRLSKIHRAPPSHEHPGNVSETCLKSPDDVLIKFLREIVGSFFLRSKPELSPRKILATVPKKLIMSKVGVI